MLKKISHISKFNQVPQGAGILPWLMEHLWALLIIYWFSLIRSNQFLRTLFFWRASCCRVCLREFYRVEGTDWNETAVSLASLCLTYTFVCQTHQTLEQSPSRPSSTQTAPYLVIQNPDADQAARMSPPFFPPIFISALQNPLCLCHFPHHFHPYLSSHAVLQVIALHHCHAPNCFFSSSCVPLSPHLISSFVMLVCPFLSLLSLSHIF